MNFIMAPGKVASGYSDGRVVVLCSVCVLAWCELTLRLNKAASWGVTLHRHYQLTAEICQCKYHKRWPNELSARFTFTFWNPAKKNWCFKSLHLSRFSLVLIIIKIRQRAVEQGRLIVRDWNFFSLGATEIAFFATSQFDPPTHL